MSESIVNKLNRNPYLNEPDIAFILTELQGFREKTSDVVESTNFIPFADETRLRQESHTVRQHLTGTSPKVETRSRQCTRNDTTMLRKISAVPKSYPFIHSFFGSNLSYPTNNTKYGASAQTDGTSYITIDDHTRLKPVNKIGIMGFLYPDVLSGIQIINEKAGSYQLRIENGQLEWNIFDGSGIQTVLSRPLTAKTWVHFAATYDNVNGKTVWTDKISSSGSESGNIIQTTNKLGIYANHAGANKLSANSRLAWLSMLNHELTQSTIDDHFAGILDTEGKSEITTIPFAGNANPQPEATFGLTAF